MLTSSKLVSGVEKLTDVNEVVKVAFASLARLDALNALSDSARSRCGLMLQSLFEMKYPDVKL